MVAPIRGIYYILKTDVTFYYIETVVKKYLSSTIDYFLVVVFCQYMIFDTFVPLFFTFTHFAV
jgi:hypothetical protein